MALDTAHRIGVLAGMIRWVELDRAQIPGGGELRLMQRGHEFSIFSGSIELMNSRRTGSEVALATLTAARIADRPAPRVLIGGLGMGFTLRAALESLPKKAEIVVAELVPEIVAWSKGPLAEIFGACLADKRVKLKMGDVANVIRDNPKGFDAIMMDVDNGPDGLNRDANDGLYTFTGMGEVRRAVKHGGILSVWSADVDQAFSGRMRRAGFAVEEVEVRASPSGKGARHIIWVGTAR